MINMHDNKVYRKILEHRNNCPKWTKEFCMDCFGGGLTKFMSNLEEDSIITLNGEVQNGMSGAAIGVVDYILAKENSSLGNETKTI